MTDFLVVSKPRNDADYDRICGVALDLKADEGERAIRENARGAAVYAALPLSRATILEATAGLEFDEPRQPGEGG